MSFGISLLFALAPPARAEEASGTSDKDWSVQVTPYVWAANIDGKIAGGPIDNTFGVGIVSLLENLSGLAMAEVDLQYKKVGIIADGVWARVDTAESQPALLAGTDRIDLQLDLALGTGAVYYRYAYSDKLSLDPYVGARWWRVSTDLMITNSTGVPPPFSGGGVVTWADPVFGLRILYEITDKWGFRAAGDVGGGVSTVNWMAMVGGTYRFTSWMALDVLYRVNGVDYKKSGDQFEVKMNGLVTGLSFRF